MPDKLQYKRVVIIGGTSGIGFAVAQGVLEAGEEVFVASSSQSKVDAAVQRLNSPKASGSTIDVGSEDKLAAFFEKTGGFDHLVYTAGDQVQLGPLDQVDVSKAKSIFDVRFWGVINSVKAARKHIKEGGSITWTSGTAAVRPQKDWAVVTGAAGAVESLTKGIAFDLAPIRVNCVMPGFVATEFWDNFSSKEAQQQIFESIGKKLPVGRVATPEDIAECYLYLMKAGFTTGTTVLSDGGQCLLSM